MPGCAAVGCNNRSEKGYIMKCFPRDPKLRKIWQDRVARADWEPSNNSFLCHVHFDSKEWSLTPDGKLRLNRNAIPSIFTVTSTRKSVKKHIKLTNVKKENCYMIESVENDTDHSLISHLEGKDSDSQDTNKSSIWSLVQHQVNNFSKKIENKQQTSHGLYIDITNNLLQSNIIILDDNMEIESNIKENDSEGQACIKNKVSAINFITKTNSTNDQSEDIVKTEIKQDDEIFNHNYDEIEEKLKQICDDREEKNTSNIEELNSTSKNQKGSIEEPIIQSPFCKSINYKYSSKNEIQDMLIDNRDNIEMIFGSESSEEFVRIPKYTFSNNETNENNKQNRHTTSIDSITNDKEITETECIEDISSRENIHIASRTAIRYEETIQEEVMRSIKTSVLDTSFEDTNSMNISDTSDIVEIENKSKEELNSSEIMRYNKDDTTKFTVKVTGDREDIYDIMHDVFKDNKNDFIIQEHNNTCSQQKNNALVTSIITIDDYPLETNSIDKCNDNISSPYITSVASRNDDRMPVALSNLKNDKFLNTRLSSSNTDEEKDLDMNNIINSDIEQPTMNNINKCEYKKLQRKVKLQETVIGELTNQLISLKDLEKKLRNKNLMLKARIKKIEKQMNKLNKCTVGIPFSTSHKEINVKHKLTYDLSNRLSYFEQMNKKLMKSITIECQQKRQLENQIKQRDKQIKELNWKLDKASKYLERSEKNTNTYRRKMLNMQTFMRRKKLVEGSMSKFDEILIDSTKKKYPEKVLAMAVEIKEICGMNGYEKLLNYGFPLPTLSVLQNFSSNNISDISKSNNKIHQAYLKLTTDEENDTQSMKNDMEVDTKNHAQCNTSRYEESMMDDTETVTGTVQDIFEESNDDMDFSTNELRDQFILQLNAVI
ncbi:PREDICTED: ankyrin repeat domain-containing protein 26-like isoform X1 [Cyphomyrmex costatus]|uniref:ankyrin repeat domain-containing protein 26-like isoform X1 n=1 Tax=Cyphomyrmex costatus TaxID=456900 RepID=UPI0008523192|nr:PREDICTED: ankyrin repeat domain-containing protein 26-like isoform X1 [Cyphomyrmex costatus]